MTTTRRLGVSEARRLLPRLVEDISTSGGRIDITRHGEPAVSLVRTSDLGAKPAAATLHVEIVDPSVDLVEVVRVLRARVGGPRALPSDDKRRTNKR